MADNDMVERVAKAIYEARNGRGCKPFAHQPQSHRDPYRADARAALREVSRYRLSIDAALKREGE